MKTTKKQRERARRIKEIVRGRWCWACRDGFSKRLDEVPCAGCYGEEGERESFHPNYRRRRIGRKEVVP